jgi:hypothetical protein
MLSNLYEIIYLLKRSAALTLSHRKKKSNCTAKEGFKLYGKELTVSNYNNSKKVSFYFPSLNNGGFFRSGKAIND